MQTHSGGASALADPRPPIPAVDGWSIAAPSGALAKLFCESPNEAAALIGRMDRGLSLLNDGFRIVPVRLSVRDNEPEATEAYRELHRLTLGGGA